MEKNNFLDFFDFLNSDFTLKEIKIFDYAIYSVFISDKIGIIFSFEFRETMPQIQFTLLDKNLELVNREGIYTLKRKFEKNNFINNFILMLVFHKNDHILQLSLSLVLKPNHEFQLSKLKCL